MPFKIHKDKLPEVTIKNARGFLAGIGIFPLEKAWFSFKEVAYSVGIIDINLNVFSNGKGTSQIYALASAYAELLERIQNLHCISSRMGVMADPAINYPDKVSVGFKDLLSQCKTILQGLLNFPAGDLKNIVPENQMVACEPFYNVFDKKIELLPKFMRLAFGSNGFCAGNTPEEALCQGIGENFERYMVRQVYTANFDFPTIPTSMIKELR